MLTLSPLALLLCQKSRGLCAWMCTPMGSLMKLASHLTSLLFLLACLGWLPWARCRKAAQSQDSAAWTALPGRPLLLRGGKRAAFEPARRVFRPFRRSEPPTSSAHEQYVVRLERQRRGEARAQVRGMLGDDRNMQYVPMDSWLIAMTSEEAAAASQLDGVLGVFILPAALRLDPSLLQSPAGVRQAHTARSSVVLDVLVGSALRHVSTQHAEDRWNFPPPSPASAPPPAPPAAVMPSPLMV